MENIEDFPFFAVFVLLLQLLGQGSGGFEDTGAVGPLERRRSHDHHRSLQVTMTVSGENNNTFFTNHTFTPTPPPSISYLGVLQSLGIGVGAVVNIFQNFGALSQMFVGISEINGGADERHVRFIVNMRFTQAGVDERRFVPEERERRGG